MPFDARAAAEASHSESASGRRLVARSPRVARWPDVRCDECRRARVFALACYWLRNTGSARRDLREQTRTVESPDLTGIDGWTHTPQIFSNWRAMVMSVSTQRYEVLILGSGAGGKLLAWHMARAGRRTAVVERQMDRRLVPEHQLPPQQERDLERQGGRPVAPRARVRADHGHDGDRHGDACGSASATWSTG